LSVELTDIIASLVGLAAVVVMLRFWTPKGGGQALDRMAVEREHEDADAPDAGGAAAAVATDVEKQAAPLTGSRVFLALFPYLLVIVIFSVAKLVPAHSAWRASTDVRIPCPRLQSRAAPQRLARLDGCQGPAARSRREHPRGRRRGLVEHDLQLPVAVVSGNAAAHPGHHRAVVYGMTARDAIDVFIVNVVKM